MKKIFLYILTIFLVTSCREDSIISNTVIDEPIPSESFIYELEVFGLVVDEEGRAIDQALIEADGKSTRSDENGYFEIEDIVSSIDGVYVMVQKDGYIAGGTLVFPNGENAQQLRVVLIEDTGSTIISNSEGGILDLQNGSQVIIPAESFAGLTEVHVQAHFIPSSKENFAEVYPSSFIGVNKDVEFQHLESIGAVVVEFRDEQGNEVGLRDGVDVTLKLPIPDGDWPTTISLWSLDEKTGYWNEESIATKVGSFYEGSVNHFSWWCASDPRDAIDACFNVQTPDGQPAPGLEYFVLSWSYSNPFFAAGFTDDEGGICIKVPEGDELAIVILDDCGIDLFEETITITPDAADRDITISSLPKETVFSGTITRCDGTAVQDGYLALTIAFDQVIVPIENGAYSFTSYCSFRETDEVEVLAVDRSDLSAASFSIPNENGQQNYVNDITLCEQLETFMNYTNETTGEELVLVTCEALRNPTETLIVANNDNSAAEAVLLGIAGFDEGNFGTSLFGLATETALPSSFTTTITKYQAVGGYIEGTFAGTTDDGNSISGQFRAERIK